MTKLHTALSLIFKNPEKLIRAAAGNGLFNFLPDELFLKMVFQVETGYKLNLNNPLTYNEKLQWIKLYDRKPEYTMYVDKFAVRDYIRKTIGEEYLIPLINVYYSVSDIDWDSLPNRFILKCTHGSGCNIICRDKSTLDIEQSKKNLNQWMKKKWYWFGREWSYKDIKPRIICEQFIEAEDGKSPVDYKFMCFNGEPKLIQVHHDRFGAHTNDFYNANWNKTDICQGVPNSDRIVPRPDTYNEMFLIAKVLSRDMAYARIDLYEVCGKVYFGEITLYPTSGFTAFKCFEDDVELGSWITLPLSYHKGASYKKS
jgi:hypothetical protein